MPESFTSQITVDKTIVSLLSKFTYERSFPYALREVVSNAYDADATQVRIQIELDKNRVVIHDNGTGMTKSEFDFYLRIAGQKRGKRETPKFGRKRVGQFGVGFLAILPFCETLRITSTTENSDEVFTAEIPAWRFFRDDSKPLDVNEVEVAGEVSRSEKLKPQHYTEITLVKLTNLTRRYFTAKPQVDRKDRVASWPVMERLKWELQEDLPLPFSEDSPLNSILAYPEPIGMEVYFQGKRLERNCVGGEVLDHGELNIEGVKFRYAIVTPWKSVKPFDARGLKLRLNNVGVGARQTFGTDIGRKYSRLHWISGEVQVLSGLDGAVTLSRDAIVATPEYEAVSEKLQALLRKWADHLEVVDVASRDITKQLRGGKQVMVAAKKEVIDKSIKTLSDRGFVVRKVTQRSTPAAPPINVDKARKEITVFEEHPAFEDFMQVAGKKRRIVYVRSTAPIGAESACRINDDGNIEVQVNYPLFRSKRYGDLFRRIYIIALLARSECNTPAQMYKYVLGQIEREFVDF